MKRTSLVLALVLLACSGEALDVGEDDSPVMASGGTGGGSAQEPPAMLDLPDWSSLGACPTTGEEAPHFAGTWEGAIDDQQLDPIAKIRMVITHATTDGVCGTISWGTDSPPPLPVTDPAQTGQVFGFGGGANFPVPGLTYTIIRGVARDRVLRVGASTAEAWRDFCAMQEDIRYFPTAQTYSCMPPYQNVAYPSGYPGETDEGDTCTLSTSHGIVVLPLKQCTACDPVGLCVCNAGACGANPDRGFGLDFTLDRSIDGVDLLVSGTDYGGIPNVRLERVP
jgi:hypothetical protein